LKDHSSRPKHSPRTIKPETALAIVELRRRRLTHAAIAMSLGVSPSTVGRVLRRAGLSRWRDLEPSEPVVRYEHEKPGDLVHIDTKKLGRIERMSHRVTGNRRDTVEGAGWEFLFVAVDDQQTPPVRRFVDRPRLDRHCAEVAEETGDKLIVVSRDVDDFGALAARAQELLDHVIVALWPIDAASERPHVDKVSHDIERIEFILAKELQQPCSLAAAGARIEGYSADVRDAEAIAAALAEAHAAIGDFDVLVSGAAGKCVAPALGMSAKGLRTVSDSDRNGTYESDRAFAVPRDGMSWREADRYARSIGKCTCEGRVGCCEECPHLHML
jgi:hypothetical protein